MVNKLKKTWLAPSLQAPAMTRTGRSRLEHRHGWLNAGWREGTAGGRSNGNAIHGAFDTRHVLCRRLSCTYASRKYITFSYTF